MNHHYPFAAGYYTTVLGYTVIMLICVAFFIYFLFVGLKTKDAIHVDPKPTNLIPSGLDGSHSPESHH